MTFNVASDVIIVDHVYPYGPDGIRVCDDWAVYYSVSEFVDRLDDDDVYAVPDLHIRVVNGEITVVTVNPFNHQPWYIC